MGNSVWNRPAANQPTVKKGGAKAPSKVKGIVAGLVTVCALGGLCLWMFSTGEADSRPLHTKKSGLIKEVTPAKGPSSGGLPPPPPPPKKKVEYKTLENGKIMKYVDGKEAWMYPRQDTAKYGISTTHVDRASLSIESRIFDTHPDRCIAYIVNSEPGDEFGDGLDLSHFTRRFLESIKTPIIVTKDDTPQEAELKRTVIAARQEIKDRYDAGEDIEHFIQDTVKELQKAYAYRKELEKELQHLSLRGEISPDEMGDYVDAANKMLEEKGYKGFSNKSVFKKRIEIRNARKARQQGGVQ